MVDSPIVTRLIIARHGNTFKAGDIITRVGARTDLPLTENAKGKAIGKYLKQHNLVPDVVFSAPLKRHRQTATLAMEVMGLETELNIIHSFNEIDYGVDENQPEAEVIARIGKDAMDKWNRYAVVPDGWRVSPQKIIAEWQNFATKLEQDFQGKTILLISSNGIMRFAPHITGDFEKFSASHNIKVSTGGICIFEKIPPQNWHCCQWNVITV